MDDYRITKLGGGFFVFSNWPETMKNIFSYLNMMEDFMEQKTVNLKAVKSKLFDIAESEWKTAVKSKPKLGNYEKFKSDMQPANYLNNFMPKFKRS